MKSSLALATVLLGLAAAQETAEEKGIAVDERASGSKYVRGCYYTNWSQYRKDAGKFLPENYEPGICTHMLYAFSKLNADFTMATVEWNDVGSSGLYKRVNDLKKKDKELKTLLSVGGAKHAETVKFQAMAKSKRTRGVFIDSAIKFVRQHNFDGVDIDWEFPAAADKQNFAALVTEARKAFEAEAKSSGKPRLLLTAAVAIAKKPIEEGYDIPAIAKSFDLVFLMAYDFHGTWDRVTGMNAPVFPRKGETPRVYNVAWAAEKWVSSGMGKEKIVLGVPTYARGWTLASASQSGVGAAASGASTVTKYAGEPGIAAYYEVCKMLKDGGKRQWQKEAQVPWLVKGNQWYSYDDRQSTLAKMELVKKSGYAGAFVWTLDFDDFKGVCGPKFPILSAIRDGLKGAKPAASGEKKPEPAPSKKPAPKPAAKKPAAKKPAASKDNKAFECTSGGFHADKVCCGKYYQCVDFGGRHGLQKYHKSCGAGLYWNPAGHCDWPAASGCKQDPNAQC